MIHPGAKKIRPITRINEFADAWKTLIADELELRELKMKMHFELFKFPSSYEAYTKTMLVMKVIKCRLLLSSIQMIVYVAKRLFPYSAPLNRRQARKQQSAEKTKR